MQKIAVVFSFVEDALTRAVALRLVDFVRKQTGREFLLSEGHPVVTRGFGKLKEKAQKLYRAENAGIGCFMLTDLDRYPSPNALGADWFGVECLSEVPPHYLFRIAVREIESWVMADREKFAECLGLSVDNLPEDADAVSDPKQFLFNLINAKCRTKKLLAMCPLPGQHVGVEYNPVMVDFVETQWDVLRASVHSASLKRSLERMITWAEKMST